MEIASKCNDFIAFLNSEKNTIKYLKDKIEKIDSFCTFLSHQDMKENFIKYSCPADIVLSVLNISILATKNPKIKPLNLESVINFFSFLANKNIPLAKGEKDIQELIKFINDIVIINISNVDKDWWSIWLKIFIEILKIPTFFNLFQEICDENDDELIFTLMKSLMKYKKISNNEWYSNQRSLALNLFLIFLKKSPYLPTPNTINSFFDFSDIIVDFELNDDFSNVLSIINKLIVLSPISFFTNQFNLSHSPFNEKILTKIYEEWHEYQMFPSLRKASSTYLLLFLTVTNALKCEMKKNFYNEWVTRILDVWSKFKSRDKIFKSSKDVAYLCADIEFLKKSNDSSISKCLLQYILPNRKINQNTNIIWLFTAIGLYAPNIIQQEDWLQILSNVSSFNIDEAAYRNLADFYNLIFVMIDIIESNSQWNDVFAFLIENQTSNEQTSPFFFKLISKFFSKQKIDTKVAHRYQYLLWNEKSSPKQYTLERLRCIHRLIYYYGFANNHSRNDCFNSLIFLLDTDETLSNEYLEQLAVNICSIISMHPFPLISIKQKEEKEISINCLYNRLAKQIKMIITKNEIPFQIESRQMEICKENEENQFSLCNFISKEEQLSFIKNINTKNVKNESNECFFRLFITSKMPNIFSPNVFYQSFLRSFYEKCNAETFPEFFKILLTITNKITDKSSDEDYATLFENIKDSFFDISAQYFEYCESKILEFFKDDSTIPWILLQNIVNEDFYYNLQLFSELAVNCSLRINEAKEYFYNCFSKFLSTSVMIPMLHLKICSNLLKLSLSNDQKGEIIGTLENVTNQVLYVLLVPVKDKEIFLEELFKSLKYEYSQQIEDLFKCISKYRFTPSMKLNLLRIMGDNYENCSQIFDCLWESENYSPFFIDDEDQIIRLQSINTIISILKLNKISYFDGTEMKTTKFDKKKYFESFISPFIEEILKENDWKIYKQTIFTAIKTLVQIAAEIPELTKESLFIIIENFTIHDYSKIFNNKCINILFSGFSKRVHFSLILRQLIPFLSQQLENLKENLESYPFELFYLDKQNVSKNEAKKLFCEESAPFLIVNSSIELIKSKNIFFIASSLLIAINEADSEEERFEIQKKYDQLNFKEKFVSPIPLLSFVLISNEDSIKASYKTIFCENNYSPEFLNIRNFIFTLYEKVCESHHELVKSYYFRQFSLYVSIIFENHKEELENKNTLYSDILAYSVNLLELFPQTESSLLTEISLNIPINFDMKMIGFVKNIEDICFKMGQHECLNNFFEKFPKLINEIMIFDFLKEIQFKERTPFIEFNRIAETKRLNQESINFLLTKFIEDPCSFDLVNNLSNDKKRTVLNEVYNFALLNPQTLALHLYSELFLNFIHIHPSPLIIDSNKNSLILLFKKLIELTRDKNSLICRSSLNSIHIFLNTKKKSIINDKFLLKQLEEYKDFSFQEIITFPNENSPWICKYVYKYIDKMNEDQFCYSFKNIVAISSEFCEQIFPLLFIDCLYCPLFIHIMSDFKKFSEDTNKYLYECKLFIKAFNYLRVTVFNGRKYEAPNWHLKWQNRPFNFQRIMEVCLKIGDPYSAYQFAEFAKEDAGMIEEPLNRIFTQLGINDLKYGLDHDFSDPLSVAELHNQEGRLENALVLYDNGNNVQKMSDTLCELHLYNLLCNLKISLSEKTIESFWRLRKWNVSSEIMRDKDLMSHHSASLFTVMQAFATNSKKAINYKLSNFTQQFHFDLNSSVFDQLSYLLDASALNWFQAVVCEKDSKLFNLFNKSLIEKYCSSLERLENLSHQFYKVAESANALHGVFFCILNDFKDEISTSLSEISPKFFSDFVSNSLENNQIESAQYFITLLHESQRKIPQFSYFEQIRVLYNDNKHRAVSLLEKKYDKVLLKNEDDKNGFNLKVEFTRASWSAHTNNFEAKQIYEKLKDVIEKCDQQGMVNLIADAEFELARVYHRQHREVCDFFMSTEYGTIISILQYEEKLLSDQKKSKHHSHIERITNQDYNNYMNIINHYKELYSTTIIKSIENYMNALIHSNKYDLESSSSIIKIWFDYNYTKYKRFVQEIPDLIKEMDEKFVKINPIKFLPLFYQLAARVDDFNTKTATTTAQSKKYSKELQIFLRKMVTSICETSPKECFPIFFAFEQNNEESKKKEVIDDLVDSIIKKSDFLLNYWNQMKILLEKYLFLSIQPKKSSYSIVSLSSFESDLADCTTDKMEYVSIITSSKEVGISFVNENVTVLNGLSRPLLIQITGTDGKIYKQIVKGNKDDLRQDAVMQQLFVLSSKLLSKKNPDLSIRNYKVVPLSPVSGVIEFVEGTTSILDYLLKIRKGEIVSGAYTRYYVNGEKYSIKEAIVEYNEKWNEYYNNNEKNEKDRLDFIDFFSNLRKKLKPVFHFFFIEKFPNPADWFISRLRYCRHTATNSMVGHIFGIGDRHLSNIMIDEKTGEVIHIDLGIAFDQGKALMYMEMVPFRLTNNLIDAMGWMGKEGVFRKNCEESMNVLRNNTEYLLTVLDVFISDPLYNWNLVPKDRKSSNLLIVSDDGPYLKKKFAESVIVTCQRKLDGRETGEKLSVEGQVSKLINDATSDENLALMYTGWKSYL